MIFFMRKCIHEILDFFFENAFMNALLFFECIYNVYNVCMYV